MMASNDTGVPKYYYFTIDHSLNYESFYEDWGPLNLANVFRTLILIHELLQVSPPLSVQPRRLNATLRLTGQGHRWPQTRSLFIK